MTSRTFNSEDIDLGLVGHWKLNDLRVATSVAFDSSRTGINGTITGATEGTDVNGIRAGATSFDGVDDFVDLNKNLNTYPENFTISMWIKRVGAQAAFARVFGAGQGGGASSFGFAIAGTSDINSTQLRFVIKTTNNDEKDIGFDPGDNEWHHWVAIKDGVSMKLFVDKNLEGTDTLTQSEYRRDVGTFIGTEGSANFGGDIANVRLYNRPLGNGVTTKLFNQRI